MSLQSPEFRLPPRTACRAMVRFRFRTFETSPPVLPQVKSAAARSIVLAFCNAEIAARLMPIAREPFENALKRGEFIHNCQAFGRHLEIFLPFLCHTHMENIVNRHIAPMSG